MAQAVQSICHKDIVDSALAAPCRDTHTPYIVAHQMMGAVLTELIAKARPMASQPAVLALACAALTRDQDKSSCSPSWTSIPDNCQRVCMHRCASTPSWGAELLEQAGVTDKSGWANRATTSTWMAAATRQACGAKPWVWVPGYCSWPTATAPWSERGPARAQAHFPAERPRSSLDSKRHGNR